MTYIKDFDAWHLLKKRLEVKELADIPYFDEREIWFCHVGCNIGYEQDGRNRDFLRPVLILKKYNEKLFMGIPLTSKIKEFPFYFEVGSVNGMPAAAIISQLRPYSSKRLVNKIEILTQAMYEKTKKAALEYIFSS